MNRTREEINKRISEAKKGIPLSPKDRVRVKLQFQQLNAQQIGEAHPRWKGKSLSYAGVHKWLERQYGKASLCQNLICKGLSKTYQWAKLRGVQYERLRDNFVQLCASCHQQYDKNRAFNISVRDLLTHHE